MKKVKAKVEVKEEKKVAHEFPRINTNYCPQITQISTDLNLG